MMEVELYAQWILSQLRDETQSVEARMRREAQLLRAAERQAQRRPAISPPRPVERGAPTMWYW